jgi:hypothetical protein
MCRKSFGCLELININLVAVSRFTSSTERPRISRETISGVFHLSASSQKAAFLHEQ